ncbi:MAG: 3-keto-disaccharide hydrolase, partial [Rubripirellula sp.]
MIRSCCIGLTLICVVVLTMRDAKAEDPADDFQHFSLPLFDGETLAGWEGNAYWFRVEDEAIVAGRLDEKIPHNEFLCTVQNYDDFELRFEAKLVGEGNNAGVQFRSKRVPKSTEVSGYQA